MQRKDTFGYPAGTDRKDAERAALSVIHENNPDATVYDTQIIETDEHKANGEFVVVIRWEDGVRNV